MNKWGDLEDAARYEQTAHYLAKAEEVPAARKQVVKTVSDELAREAVNLRKAVMSHDEKETTAVLTRINYQASPMCLDD